MWKYIVVDSGRPQMTIWHMHTACWIPKATNTSSEYIIIIVLSVQQWLHDHASELRYTYIACLLHPLLRFPLGEVCSDLGVGGIVHQTETTLVCSTFLPPEYSQYEVWTLKTTQCFNIEQQVKFNLGPSCH
jgi:hypothetical protein